MLKLPCKRRIRWFLAGGVLLGLVAVLQVLEDRETDANRSGPPVSSSSGIVGNTPGGAARPGPEGHARTIGVDAGIKAGSREITPDPGKSAATPPPAVAEAESYLSADATDPALATGDAAAETVDVGEYIDPEGIVTGADDPVVLVGEYLDPDAEITGG